MTNTCTQQQSPMSLCVGTWNVHNWYDGDGKENKNRIIQSLEKTPVDILGLQEVLEWGKEGKKKGLDFKYSSIDQLKSDSFYNGVVMESKYRIICSHRITNRLQLHLVEFTKEIMIGIIVAHFNYRSEEQRIKEHWKISHLIANNQELPLIFLGDFNALTRSDYTDSEWERITEIRKENKWEEPQTEFMDMVRKKDVFIDSLHVFRDWKNQQNIENEDDDVKEEVEVIQHQDDGINDRMDSNVKDLNDDGLNGMEWSKVLGKRKIGTCRFDTRIDYVLINQKMQSMFDVVEYQHLAHQDASDHKLVRVRFQLKCNTKM